MGSVEFCMCLEPRRSASRPWGTTPRTCPCLMSFHASLFVLQLDSVAKGRRVEVTNAGSTGTVSSSGDRCLALGTVGFSSGVHYWEVHIDSADHGSVFVGVCPRNPDPAASPATVVEQWNGWGFVNFRATYHEYNERVYGEFFSPGDIIGVKLDMDSGVLSFFLDGLRFGDHVLADMGPAYDMMRDNQSGLKATRMLYPAVGFKRRGDKVRDMGMVQLSCVDVLVTIWICFLPDHRSVVGILRLL